jgi:hypothetical protein
MDTQANQSICIHKRNGGRMIFKEHTNGLYYFDTKLQPPFENLACLLQSVNGSKNVFINQEVDTADAAREIYRKIGRPSEAKFEEIISKNLIRNCPVTVDDIQRALVI